MGVEPEKSEPSLSDRVMTCAACTRTLRVVLDGVLPAHRAESPSVPRLAGSTTLCAGSWTRGYPARPVPEIENAA
jgi:hypothetical protein